MKTKLSVVVICVGVGIGYYLGGIYPSEIVKSPEIPAELEREKALPLTPLDYSFGYWKNGMRKHADDKSSDILCIETGYFGLELDMAKLDQAKFGAFDDSLDYAGALAADGKRMQSLDPAELSIELEKDGKIYRAVSCRAAEERSTNSRFHSTRLWESARYVQHFDIQKLVFQDSTGSQLIADAKLNVQAWPDSLSLTAEIAPAVDYKGGPELGVQGNGHCVIENPLLIEHLDEMEHETFTLETWIKIPESHFYNNRGWILNKNKHEGVDGNFGFSVADAQVTAVMNIGGVIVGFF